MDVECCCFDDVFVVIGGVEEVVDLYGNFFWVGGWESGLVLNEWCVGCVVGEDWDGVVEYG